MKHIHLTCLHHPALRWSCKEIAWTDECGYNGVRSLHYLGHKDDEWPNYSPECKCPVTDLRTLEQMEDHWDRLAKEAEAETRDRLDAAESRGSDVPQFPR